MSYETTPNTFFALIAPRQNTDFFSQAKTFNKIPKGSTFIFLNRINKYLPKRKRSGDYLKQTLLTINVKPDLLKINNRRIYAPSPPLRKKRKQPFRFGARKSQLNN